jgi:hypothetical protein
MKWMNPNVSERDGLDFPLALAAWAAEGMGVQREGTRARAAKYFRRIRRAMSKIGSRFRLPE